MNSIPDTKRCDERDIRVPPEIIINTDGGEGENVGINKDKTDWISPIRNRSPHRGATRERAVREHRINDSRTKDDGNLQDENEGGGGDEGKTGTR